MGFQTNYNLTYEVPTSSGSGGAALDNNFIELNIRGGPCNWAGSVDPTATEDSAHNFLKGSKWFNTTTGILWICVNATPTAAVWKPITGSLQISNNLSDLASASSARTHLGLGTSAVLDVGTTANKVVQLDGTAKLPAVDGSQLTNLPSSGTALQASNNLSDLASVSTARTHLGLGSAATHDSTDFDAAGAAAAAATASLPLAGGTTTGPISSVLEYNLTSGTSMVQATADLTILDIPSVGSILIFDGYSITIWVTSSAGDNSNPNTNSATVTLSQTPQVSQSISITYTDTSGDGFSSTVTTDGTGNGFLDDGLFTFSISGNSFTFNADDGTDQITEMTITYNYDNPAFYESSTGLSGSFDPSTVPSFLDDFVTFCTSTLGTSQFSVTASYGTDLLFTQSSSGSYAGSNGNVTIISTGTAPGGTFSGGFTLAGALPLTDSSGSLFPLSFPTKPTNPFQVYWYDGQLWANNASGTSQQLTSF